MNAPDLADNVILLGHTDQGGRGDGVQVMVGDGERPAWPSERRYGLHHAIVADGLADASWLFATYQNAGVRVFDLANPFAPRQVGASCRALPERISDTRPNWPRVSSPAGVSIDRDAVMYVTDYNAGLYVLQYEPDLLMEPVWTRSGSSRRQAWWPPRRRFPARRRPATRPPGWPRSSPAAPPGPTPGRWTDLRRAAGSGASRRCSGWPCQARLEHPGADRDRVHPRQPGLEPGPVGLAGR